MGASGSYTGGGTYTGSVGLACISDDITVTQSGCMITASTPTLGTKTVQLVGNQVQFLSHNGEAVTGNVTNTGVKISDGCVWHNCTECHSGFAAADRTCSHCQQAEKSTTTTTSSVAGGDDATWTIMG